MGIGPAQGTSERAVTYTQAEFVSVDLTVPLSSKTSRKDVWPRRVVS
jgi:hypothetical protein